MSNLFGTMRTSLTALEAIQESVGVAQNNITNASVPGYARQRLGIVAREYNPLQGLSGGVAITGLINSRDQFAETTVRSQVSMLSYAEATLASAKTIETALDLNGAGSVASTLDKFFAASTAWSLTPNSEGAKENVLAAAEEVARSFRRTAGTISDGALNAERNIATALDEINGIAERVRQYNVDRRTGTGYDAGVDASLHVDLEKLSEFIDVRAIWQEDGTIMLLAGGEAPLVVGDKSFALSLKLPPEGYPKAVRVVSELGADVTDNVATGKVGALLNFRNEAAPKVLGGGGELGDLDHLAKQFAERVNKILETGYPPEDYQALFDLGTSPISIAHAIKVNPALTAAFLSGKVTQEDAPDFGAVNGIPLALAGLAQPTAAEDKIDGLSYISYFGKMSADAGRVVASAKQETDARTQLTAQARNMRSQVAGVSLDEEAVELVQLQHAYQATARMITTVDEMLQIVLSIGR